MLVYNHAAFLKKALDSILQQKVNFDIEIIAGDDCSTDNGLEILEEYALENPGKFKIIKHQSNVGIYQNLQDVFKACNGQYIAWLEGDDFWTSSTKLQQQIDFLDANPDFSICFHRVSVINNLDNKLIYNYPAKNYKSVSTIEDLLQCNFMQTCAVVYRNGLVKEIPEWFSGLKLADWPLHILHAEYGKIAYINQIMGTYRVHNKGVWSGNTLIYRNSEVIKMLDAINIYSKLKYNQIINTTITNLYFDNVRLAIDNKDWNASSEYNKVFISLSKCKSYGYGIKILRIKIKYFLKKHLPFLHDIIDYTKDVIVKLIISLR